MQDSSVAVSSSVFPLEVESTSMRIVERARLKRWLIGLVAGWLGVNLSLVGVTGLWFMETDFPSMSEQFFNSLIGVHLGQWLLLLIWMSFGRFRMPWRQLVCTLIVFGGAALLIAPAGMSSTIEWLQIACLMTGLLWAGYLLLLPIGWFFSIQIEFRQLLAEAPRVKRTFGVGSILMVMIAAAIGAELIQLALSHDQEWIVTQLIVLAIIFAAGMATSIPLALMLLATRRFGVWLTVFIVSQATLIWLAYAAEDWFVFGRNGVFIVLGQAIAILVNFGLLRSCGLRWLPLAPAASDAGEAVS